MVLICARGLLLVTSQCPLGQRDVRKPVGWLRACVVSIPQRLWAHPARERGEGTDWGAATAGQLQTHYEGDLGHHRLAKETLGGGAGFVVTGGAGLPRAGGALRGTVWPWAPEHSHQWGLTEVRSTQLTPLPPAEEPVGATQSALPSSSKEPEELGSGENHRGRLAVVALFPEEP